MSSHQTRIRPRGAVTAIRHWPTERTRQTRPIVTRKEIEIVVKRRHRLVFDDLEDLVHCVSPISIQDRRVVGVGIVRAGDFEETAE